MFVVFFLFSAIQNLKWFFKNEQDIKLYNSRFMLHILSCYYLILFPVFIFYDLLLLASGDFLFCFMVDFYLFCTGIYNLVDQYRIVTWYVIFSFWSNGYVFFWSNGYVIWKSKFVLSRKTKNEKKKKESIGPGWPWNQTRPIGSVPFLVPGSRGSFLDPKY